jgi:hypothetical protein
VDNRHKVAESRRIEKSSPTLVVSCMPSQEKIVAARCQRKELKKWSKTEL